MLYVHDSDGEQDRHWFPYSGAVDWADFTRALKEVGFEGVMSLETEPSEELNMDAYKAMNKALALIAKQLTE